MTTTPCPNCGTPVELFDTGSASATCPGCRAVVRRSAAASDAVNWGTTSFALKTQVGILLVLIFGFAAAVGSLRFRIEDGAAICLVPVLPLVHFACLCICGSAPDRTARRSAIACVLTLVLGTAGLFGAFAVLMFAGVLEVFAGQWTAISFGIFVVYFSALVFLLRFHAAVAAAFGNRWLERECYVYLFFPLAAVVANVWVEEFRFGPPPIFDSRDMVDFARIVMNFGVALWYETILYRTFRTIDRGPVGSTGLADADVAADEPPGD